MSDRTNAFARLRRSWGRDFDTKTLARLWALTGLATLVVVSAAQAGGVAGGANANFYQLSAQVGLTAGDYVSNSATGLNTYYAYFIEVPPGTGQLNAEIFDGEVTGGSLFDINSNAVQYQLFDPTGVQVVCHQCGGAPPPGCPAGACINNGWWDLGSNMAPPAPGIANPIPGHWELRVDMSLPISLGQALNGYAVRANDGNAGAGGVELNVYGHAYTQPGVANGSSPPVTFQLYPYVSSDCEVDSNDFDLDSPNATINVFTRTGVDLSAQTGTVSANGVWQNNPLTMWTDCSTATDYGIWNSQVTFLNAQNWSTYYWGDASAANPPPTAQPEANTFRIYLPQDSAAAPVKTHVGQQVTFINGSGPNPPTVGNSSLFSITVTVMNPTPHPILFAAPTDVVQIFVPSSGGQVLFVAGSSAASQGTVTEPGGTPGTVTWDPGRIEPGATALLTYRVQATPSAAGTIDVTGTPAANGTTAVYVDGTCTDPALPATVCAGAQLAGATVNFGPLCTLAVKTTAATPATVASFEAFSVAGRTAVEWRTGSEAGILGFRLYRRDLGGDRIEPVGERLTTSQPGSEGGAAYRLLDEARQPTAPAEYFLVEITASGERRAHGPFVSAAPLRPRDAALETAGPTPSRRPAPTTRRAVRRTDPGPAIKIAIDETGLYRLSSAEIASGFGVPEAAVRAAVRARGLRLTNRGLEVAWLGAPGGLGLVFWGEAVDSIYTRSNVYRLTRGPGRRVEGVDGLAPPALADPLSVSHTIVVEENLFAATASATDPESDFWYWEYLSAGDPELESRSFEIEIDALDDSGDAELQVELASATTVGEPDEHHAEIYLNDLFVGELLWDGLDRRSGRLEIRADQLVDGVNRVEIRALLGQGISHSILYVDEIGLTYPRYLLGKPGGLSFGAEGHAPITVGDLAGADVELWEVTDPSSPRRVGNLTIDGGPDAYRASFVPPEAFGDYFVARRSDDLRLPAAVWPDQPSSWSDPANAADHLVITDHELEPAARALVDHRSAAGLDSELVLVEDLYDEFNRGLASPHAVRDFLVHAWESWASPPRFVVLAGLGNYDYADHLGLGENRLPPLLTATSGGLYASDQLLADLADGDGAPEIAVGRIPASSAAELQAYVDKLISYEVLAPDEWMRDVVLAADAADLGYDFDQASLDLAAWVPGDYSQSPVFLDELPIAAARDELFELLGGGASWLNYFGHGGLDRLAAAGLLTLQDLDQLDQGSRLPVVSALTCALNRFEVPGTPALGPELVLDPDGGAIAVWSATGLSEHPWAAELADELYRRAFIDEAATLGEVLADTVRSYVGEGGSTELALLYNLIGDPATRLSRPPVALEQPAPDDELQ